MDAVKIDIFSKLHFLGNAKPRAQPESGVPRPDRVRVTAWCLAPAHTPPYSHHRDTQMLNFSVRAAMSDSSADTTGDDGGAIVLGATQGETLKYPFG